MSELTGIRAKAAIVGASAESLHTIAAAKAAGVRVTALDGNPEAEGLKAADEAMVVDIRDEAAVIDALRKVQPDFLVTAPIGRYLTATGAANDALGLPGISREAASLCTDKWRFHRALHGEGLRGCFCALIPAGTRVRTRELIPSQDSGTPGGTAEPGAAFILKPRFGSGSRAIEVYQSEELPEFLCYDEDFVLEELVDGQEYGVDGAVTGGKFTLVLLRKKTNTPLPARQSVAYESVLPGALTEQASAYVESIVRVLGIDESLLHCDLLLRRSGGFFVIELSARPSGHYLHDLFTPLVTGVDVAETMVRHRISAMLSGGGVNPAGTASGGAEAGPEGEEAEGSVSFAPEHVKPMMIRYFDLTGRLESVPSKEEAGKVLAENGALLVRWDCRLAPGMELEPPVNGHILMSRGYMIIEGARDLEKAAEAVLARFVTVKE